MLRERPIPGWFEPLNERLVIRGRRRLPHWEQPGATYFVTFRLADAVARETYERWAELRDDWIARHALSPDDTFWNRYREEVSERMEQLLDAGHGACWLRRPDVRKMISDALLHFDWQRYRMDTFVIMPNHVHVLFALINPVRLKAVLHSWKSFTANCMGCMIDDAEAPFWLDESFDHIVRDENAFLRYRAYIAENPVKARLPAGDYHAWQAAGG